MAVEAAGSRRGTRSSSTVLLSVCQWLQLKGGGVSATDRTALPPKTHPHCRGRLRSGCCGCGSARVASWNQQAQSTARAPPYLRPATLAAALSIGEADGTYARCSDPLPKLHSNLAAMSLLTLGDGCSASRLGHVWSCKLRHEYEHGTTDRRTGGTNECACELVRPRGHGGHVHAAVAARRPRVHEARAIPRGTLAQRACLIPVFDWASVASYRRRPLSNRHPHPSPPSLLIIYSPRSYDKKRRA